MAARVIKQAASAKDWCFTLNNYTEEDCTTLEQLDVQYICYGREVGESGTPHIQGFVQMKKGIRMTALKKITPFHRAHLEKRRGTAPEARDYTSKDGEENWVERGFMSEEGVGQLTTLTEMALQNHDAEDLYTLINAKLMRQSAPSSKLEKKRLKSATSNAQLKVWQDWCVHHLDCQNDRKILWIEESPCAVQQPPLFEQNVERQMGHSPLDQTDRHHRR
ncbi:uncharacterized protein LOC128244403 [Mya arenaria]|uniref:uncharacterized protein LOC128244403 n=1 Tax=Mya arenaria TaxID=6604 RepID=UPI0022E4F55A|nr:uncharacterized protein LOC128244403 [Mya arenaria]